jgi:hypothetical protein
VLSSSFCPVVKHLDAKLTTDITKYESRTEPRGITAYGSYGTAGLGLDLTAEVWPMLTQEFMSAGSTFPSNCPGRPECNLIPSVARLPLDILTRHSVTILVLGSLDLVIHEAWLRRVKASKLPPCIVLEYWHADWALKESGPMAKLAMEKWSRADFRSRCSMINATQVGGVVDRQWLMVARVRNDQPEGWTWPKFPEEIQRPMNNCLGPAGVPWSAFFSSQANGLISHHPLPSTIPDCDVDAMPA